MKTQITKAQVRLEVRTLAKKIDRLYQRVVDADGVFGLEWRAAELLSDRPPFGLALLVWNDALPL